MQYLIDYYRILEYFPENDMFKKSYSYLLLDLKLPPTFFFRGSNVADRSNFKLFLLVSVNSRSNDLLEGTNFACFGPENIFITFNISNIFNYDFTNMADFKFLDYSAWRRRRSGVFVVNFEHISHLVLVFLLLTLNM